MHEELINGFDKSDKISKELSESIIKLINDSGINDVNYGLGLGETLGKVLDEFDYRYDDNDNRIKGIGNLSDSINSNHRKTIINSEIPNIKMLYDYLVDNDYSEDNKFDIGYGDRYMCYIEKSPGDDYDVIYYENQNVKFIICVKIGSIFHTAVHIRRVYDSIIGSENEEEYRQELKKDTGLEFALKDLTHSDYLYANNVKGNDYPDKFTLEDSKLNGYKDGFNNNEVLRYRDARDKGYILSCSHMVTSIHFINDTKYIWGELLSGISCVPNDYKIVYNRERELDILGD